MASLRDAAAEATQIRDLQTRPEVVALRVERIATQVQRLMWGGILLGLGFTMANVQAFAAAGSPRYSLTWWAAWLLDPMVSLVLIAILIAEQTIARYRVTPGPWVRRAKWTTLAATYTMNTWSAWEAVEFRLIMLHSIPPIAVFVAAEAVTDLRYRLTETIERAAHAWTPTHPERTRTGTAPTTSARRSQSDAVATPADAEPATVPIPVLEPNPDPTGPSPESSSEPTPRSIGSSDGQDRTDRREDRRGGSQHGSAAETGHGRGDGHGDGAARDTGGSRAGSDSDASDAPVEIIARWVAAGEELDGAAVAQRIGASPRTGKPVSARQGRRLLQQAAELVDARSRAPAADVARPPVGESTIGGDRGAEQPGGDA